MNLYDWELEERTHSPEVEALYQRLRPHIKGGRLIILNVPGRAESEFFNRGCSDSEWITPLLFNSDPNGGPIHD